MKSRLLFLSTLLCIALAPVYSAVVTGRVTDVDGSGLPGVSVRIMSLPDSVNKALVVTETNGGFKAPRIAAGNYMLHLSMIGMDDIEKAFQVPDTARTVNLGRFDMHEAAVTLSDAIVTAVKDAVVAKQDTMEFNADSFKTQTNATVEDLLKKLPGVEVASDGSITSGGKSVTKILIDGKEFFSDDPTMASKNLPSDLVDKVQVVDRKSDLARLTGVDDGEEETVINLTVKKNMRNGWLGTIQAGYGTDKRYDGQFNISTFTNTNQISIVGGLNNVNNLGFSDSGRGRFNGFGQNGGITTAQRLGLNFNLGKTEDLRFGGNVMYSHSEREATSKTTTFNDYGDGVTQTSTGSSLTNDGGHNVRGDFRLQWKIDEYNTLDFRPNFSFNSRSSFMNTGSELRNQDNQLINSQESDRALHGTSWNAGGRLIFNHNFKSRPGRSISAHVNYTFSNTRQYTTSWSNIAIFMKDDSEEGDELLYRYLDNHSWTNSINGRLTWTEPLGDVKKGNFLQIGYNVSYRFNNADLDTYNVPLPTDLDNFVMPDYTYTPDGAVIDLDLSNSYRNTFSSHELQIGYKKVNANYNLTAGFLVSPSSLKSTDLINPERNIATRWTWNYAPFVRFRYKFSKTTSLRADYRARSSEPSISQLQPVADVSDPMNIKQGNPNLKPSFAQTINLNFNHYNTATQQSIFAMTRMQYTRNVVVSRTTTNMGTGERYTTYANANGAFNIFGMVMLNQQLHNRHWRINARINGNYSTSPGYINGDFNRAENLRVSPAVGMTYSCDYVQYTLNPTYTMQLTGNSLPKQPNRMTHTYGFNTDLTVFLPFGLNLNTSLLFGTSTGYSDGFNTTSWLWNAELSYSILRDKSLTFSVKAYDILGMNKSVSRSQSDNQITDTENNTLTRYVMFGVAWKFNTMKGHGKQQMEMDGLPMPPGGDRGGMRPMGPPPGGRRPF